MKIEKIMLLFLFCATLLTIICSCVVEKAVMLIDVSPANMTLPELASVVYTDSVLTEISQYSGTLLDLDKSYSIECVRYSNNAYRVSYLGQNKMAVIWFDQKGNRLLGKLVNVKIDSESLLSLNQATHVEEVQRIDPNGEYHFLFTGRNDIPRVSTHYTNDGYLITISYNNDLSINEISFELL